MEYLSTLNEIEKKIESAALFREPVYEVIVKIKEALRFCEREKEKKEIREQAVSRAQSNASPPNQPFNRDEVAPSQTYDKEIQRPT